MPKNSLKLLEVLNKFLTVINNEVDSATDVKEDASGQVDNLANKDNEKNTRIIPKRSRLNSSGEEIFDVD